MPGTTSRGAFPYPVGSDAPATLGVNTAIQNLANQAATVNALYAQGTHAARPAAASSNAGSLYWETDTNHLFYSNGSLWRPADAITDINAASWPSGPVAGQRILQVIATASVRAYWEFTYDASLGDAYKWAFVGGHPIWAEGTSGTFTGDGTDKTPAGQPSITLPFAGIWRIAFKAQIQSGSATWVRARLRRSSSSYTAAEAANVANRLITPGDVVTVTESAASIVYDVAVAADAGSPCTLDSWRIEALPVRVSP